MKLPPITQEHFNQCSVTEICAAFEALDGADYDPDGLCPLEIFVPLKVQIAVQSAIRSAPYAVGIEDRPSSFKAYWYAHNSQELGKVVFREFWSSVRGVLFDYLMTGIDPE